MTNIPVLEPGDVFASKGHGLLAKAIRRFTQTIGERRTVINHVGIVVTGGPPSEVMIVEALSSVKEHRFSEHYGGPGTSDISVFRAVNLSAEEKAKIVEAARSYVGRKYGPLKLLAHLADWVLQGVYLFRRLAFLDRYPICSWVVAHSFAKVGKHFGVAPGAASPDDIWDFVTTKTEKYSEIISLGPLSRYLKNGSTLDSFNNSDMS